MKKLLFAIPLTLAMGACTGENTKAETPIPNETETTQEEAPQEEQREVVTDRPAQKIFVESILGEWTCDAATTGVQIAINIKDDGSIFQKVGVNETIQRYVALDGDRLQLINEKGETFQTWEVKNITKNSMDVCWNPESPDPKTIPYTRK